MPQQRGFLISVTYKWMSSPQNTAATQRKLLRKKISPQMLTVSSLLVEMAFSTKCDMKEHKHFIYFALCIHCYALKMTSQTSWHDDCMAQILNGVCKRSDGSTETAGSGSNIVFGLLPAGSTNTVALTLIGTADVASCALSIVLGHRRTCDLGRADRDDGIAPQYFTNFVGFGFFGDVIAHSEGYRWCGPARYKYSGFVNLMRGRRYKVDLHIDAADSAGAPVLTNKRYKAINCALQQCITFDAKQGMAPGVGIDDGQFYLILVKSCSRLRYLQYLMRTADKSDQYALKHVQLIKCRRVTVSPHERRGGNRWNCDGELLRDKSLTLTAIQRGISLFTPAPEIIQRTNV
eukprot:m.535273 g.535273  ORF g.535273 m.535273 type:complete len:348 (+) comp22064_c0_seq9:940-1983(+)